MKKYLRFLRRILSVLRGRDIIIRPIAVCHGKIERFGSAYGGWNIITDTINRNSVIYSFGVGEDASFDLALIHRFDLCVHAFDPTPKSINWVHSQNFGHLFVLHEFGLAAEDGEVSFSPPENPEHISHTILDRPSTRDRAISVPVKRLQTIMQELGHNNIDILKMDIEGAEYRVIDDLRANSIRPGQILVEFHHRFPGVGAAKTKTAVTQLRAMGYTLFHVSDSGEEFSFIQKK